jgi:hypothetical protein
MYPQKKGFLGTASCIAPLDGVGRYHFIFKFFNKKTSILDCHLKKFEIVPSYSVSQLTCF